MWSNKQYLCMVGFLCIISVTICQSKSTKKSFVKHFANCKRNTTEFDNCIKDGLNEVRRFFKTGVPELNIPPFDPFFASEVVQKRGNPDVNYNLKLLNVTESGWTASIVTKFRSNLQKGFVQYTQFFPDKRLSGHYTINSKLMNNTGANNGTWNLTLYDLIQTTTIVKPKGSDKLKVMVNVQTIGDLDLHISNLLRGRTAMESLLDLLINRMWQPGFRVIRPLINDLVSTAFTDIFTKAFKDVDFDKILPN